jgi:3-oxoacyl-(acyl-carrier-protein) synthase
MRRVVVTGLGIVTPLATGIEETWSEPVGRGSPGQGTITALRRERIWPPPMHVKCKLGDGTDGTFNPDDWMAPKERLARSTTSSFSAWPPLTQAIKLTRAGRPSDDRKPGADGLF